MRASSWEMEVRATGLIEGSPEKKFGQDLQDEQDWMKLAKSGVS